MIKRKMTLITPSFANQHPPHPTRQRNMSQAQVEKYVQLIKANKFLQGEDVPPIYIDADGFIVDGQHRVAAIARSGKQLMLPVIYSADVNRVAVFADGNRKRTVVDRAWMMGRQDYTNDAHTAVSYAWCDERGMRSNSVQSKNHTDDSSVWLSRWDWIKDAYDILVETQNTCRTSSSLKKRAPGVPVVLGTLCRILTQEQEFKEEILEFWKIFLNGAVGSTHQSARFPNFLREVVLEHGMAISSNDHYRKALVFVTLMAVFDFLTASKKSSKYRMPIKTSLDHRGLVIHSLDESRCVNHFPVAGFKQVKKAA